MTPGELALEVSLSDLAVGIGGFSELRFHESGQEAVTIMSVSDSKPALACKACGFFMIINDDEYTESECIECHTKMLAGVTSCPKCGWTYEVSLD
jgi:predicted RNA-binding Zn-ribbon protein involved in translation (DUF1610 family)